MLISNLMSPDEKMLESSVLERHISSSNIKWYHFSPLNRTQLYAGVKEQKNGGGGRFSRRARKYLLNWEDNNRHYPRVLADIGKYFTFVNIEKSGFLDTPSALHPGSLRLVWTSISG